MKAVTNSNHHRVCQPEIQYGDGDGDGSHRLQPPQSQTCQPYQPYALGLPTRLRQPGES